MRTPPVSTASHLTAALSRESIAITAVCIFDLLTTLVLVAVGLAEEANPLMALCLRHGMVTFCLVKLGTMLALVGLAEWYRRRNPHFVRNILRGAIAAYVLLYLGLLLVVNFA